MSFHRGFLPPWRQPCSFSSRIFSGRRLDHEVSGFLSALILATNYQFLGNARESVMDMTFAFFIGLAIFLGYLCMEKERRELLPFALLPCAFAILTKGPAGLVLPVVVLFFYSIATKRLKSMFVPLVASCLLSVALASIWFILAGKAYTVEFVLHQNITRYTTGFDHVEPFTYYFHKLFVNFLPWSVALPFAAFFAYKRRLWLPLIWLVFTFLFFDISKSKRAIYLLSCYPACALLVGIYLKEQWYALVEKRWTTAILCFFGLALLAVPALLFPAMHRVPFVAEMFGKDMLFPAIIVAVLGGRRYRLPSIDSEEGSGKGFYRALCLPLLSSASFTISSTCPPWTKPRNRLLSSRTRSRMQGLRPFTRTASIPRPSSITSAGPSTILKDPSELPAKKDGIIVVVEDKGDNADQFRRLFSF